MAGVSASGAMVPDGCAVSVFSLLVGTVSFERDENFLEFGVIQLCEYIKTYLVVLFKLMK